jgi:hypothetical protein
MAAGISASILALCPAAEAVFRILAAIVEFRLICN